VKKNAIAGRRFESWSALEAHLDGWMREIADNRIHGTTGEAPIERFRRAEGALRSIAGVPPFAMARELVRKVQADCAVEVDSNAYSVPWRLIGESVRIVIAGDTLRVSHAGCEVAVHQRRIGRFERVVDPKHFDGVAGFGSKAVLELPQLSMRSARPSCCGRCSNTSAWSEGAGDGARSSDRDAEPAQADGDPRPTRQPG
jgi:hypothetical protein